MTDMTSWQHMIRFEAEDGKSYLATCSNKVPRLGSQIKCFTSFDDLETKSIASTTKTIKKILPPAAPGNPIICIGLNYSKHAEEANMTVPKFPPMWYKPASALAGPGDIPVPKVAQDNFPDYEGEFIIITSKDARNVTKEDAPGYILGYTVGNDLTARMFQAPHNSGGQYTYAKAFDKFAPLAPVVVNPKTYGSVKDKKLKTKINGKVVQSDSVDLIWGPAELVSHLSQGRILPAGTAIMTGTPAGVGWFQEPKRSLKDGDVVEISIEGIGSLSNTMKFE